MLRSRSNWSTIRVDPEVAGGRHLRHAGDAAELALERRGHRRGHRFGARAGQARGHLDRRELDLRQRRHRQAEKRDAAGQGHRDRQQRGGNRTAR